MSLQTGIDVVDISRFEALLDKHGEAFTTEFFTDREREYARTGDSTARCYATYWALREAAYKIGGGSLWNDYSVDPSGTQFKLIVAETLYDRDDARVPASVEWSSSTTLNDATIIATVFARWGSDVT